MSAGASRKLSSSNVLGDQEGTAADPARAYILLVHLSTSPSAPIYWQAEPHAAKTGASECVPAHLKLTRNAAISRQCALGAT